MGYWSSNNQAKTPNNQDSPTPTNERKSIESSRTGQTSIAGSGTTTPAPSAAGDGREEEVNLEVSFGVCPCRVGR